jgi:hypothetical protein
MVEKNVKGRVEDGKGGLKVDTWLDRYINADNLRGERLITTTFGPRAEIPEYQAAFVFVPVPARG